MFDVFVVVPYLTYFIYRCKMCVTKNNNIPNAKSMVIYQRGKKMIACSLPILRGSSLT
jgi:hypothetical protein